MLKIQYRLGDHAAMLAAYRDMLSYTQSAVTRNAAEKKVNSVLDFVSQSTDAALLQEFYALTLAALAEAKNERLWFKTNMKLAHLWVSLKEGAKAARVLRDLRRSCQDGAGGEDARKGTQLLEVFALEIQMHTEQRNAPVLKDLYRRALAIKSAIPHPRIMGVIRECGGKMHMAERRWAAAATDFFEAFKSYDEAGAAARTRCLKYLVLSSMLMESGVDPFDSQEARPYRGDPEVAAMTGLVEAYQAGDIAGFERALRSSRATILGDPFISPHIEDLLRKVRTAAVLRVVAPYTRVRLGFVAAALGVGTGEVEALLVGLVLDGRVAGRIDQVGGVLELEGAAEQGAKYEALGKWAAQAAALHAAAAARLVA